MTVRPRRPGGRDDLHDEAGLIGWVSLALALLCWSLFARAVAGVQCGPACSSWSGEVTRMVVWLALAVGSSLAVAASYVVSAVSRLCDAEPPGTARASLSAGSADG